MFQLYLVKEGASQAGVKEDICHAEEATVPGAWGWEWAERV